MKTAVAYVRVSTQQQGRSGLGLEAQQAQIAAFAAAEGFTITATFVEVETGKAPTRSMRARNWPPHWPPPTRPP